MVRSEIIVDCSKEHFLDVVWDFDNYSKFLKEVKSITYRDIGPDEREVTYEIDLIKTVKYTLKMKRSQDKIEWSFIKGDVMKDNYGSWEVQDAGDGKTKVIYQVEIKFGLLVPGKIVDMLTKVNLPEMLNSFKAQAEKK